MVGWRDRLERADRPDRANESDGHDHRIGTAGGNTDDDCLPAAGDSSLEKQIDQGSVVGHVGHVYDRSLLLVDLWTDDRLATHHPRQLHHVRARRRERNAQIALWIRCERVLEPYFSNPWSAPYPE